MKLVHFNEGRLGVVQGSSVRDVTHAVDSIPAARWPVPVEDPLIVGLSAVRERVEARLGSDTSAADGQPLDTVRLCSPITSPSKVVAAPANYRLHVEVDAKDPGIDFGGFHSRQLEGVEKPVERLGLFLKATSSITGAAAGVRVESTERRVDHELELAVIIGETARHVSQEDAFDYVAGYCVGLDMTIRGREDRSFRKSGDTFTVLGPWLTTADEVEDPQALKMWLSVNGDTRQSASTSEMTVGIRRLIEMASAMYTLHPGDVLLTGTPHGVGPVYPSDIMIAGIESLGEMTVPVLGPAEGTDTEPALPRAAADVPA